MQSISAPRAGTAMLAMLSLLLASCLLAAAMTGVAQ